MFSFGQVVQQRFNAYYRTNNYENTGSDNCDHNFSTFDDFGVKNDQKVSHNMILMSKYKGQHGGKKGQKIRARPSPPLFKEIDFFLWEVFPKLFGVISENLL